MFAEAPPIGLIGAHVLVLVAQPWDFVSRDGRGRLRAVVHSQASDGGEFVLRFAPFTIGGAPVEALRALPLHPMSESLARGLGRGDSVGVRLHAWETGARLILVGAMRRRA